jgi:hypothetical protein
MSSKKGGKPKPAVSSSSQPASQRSRPVPNSVLNTVGVSAVAKRQVKYYTTFSNTIADVLGARGWKEVGEHDDWDFVWGDREWIYAAFDKVLCLCVFVLCS